MSRSLFAVVSVACAALWAAPASAYVREETNWDPRTLPIPYRVNASSIPSSLGASVGTAAVEGGFATWAGPTCTAWRATDAGTTTSAPSTRDGVNTISWVSGSWPSELGDPSTVIGITTPVWTVGAYFIDADIRFNNVGFRWSTTGTGGTVDAQSIATHEEGHFLGLDHTPTSSAIMYASYTSGLKRTLVADDSNGVCAIYPSGVTPPPVDAGMGTSTDPCTAHGTTCDACTPYDGCGFCGATSACVSGTETGPVSGSCASGYVWYPADCTTDPGGTARFGDPCASPTDCGSGSLCVSDGTSAFCSRSCVDDCGCPDGYACVATTDPSLSVCAPGTRMCGSTAVDAGMVARPDAAVGPGHDAAVTPGTDASMPEGTDAGSPVETDGAIITVDDTGVRTRATRSAGCACSAPGRSEGTPTSSALFGLAIVGLFVMRRRTAN
jgi:MYXO-CTERM domain-containing protein